MKRPYIVPGLTVFRGIGAFDRDRPNSANSEITYSIVSGDPEKRFSLEGRSSSKAVLVLRKPVDYDKGEHMFNMTIKAQVRRAISS